MPRKSVSSKCVNDLRSIIELSGKGKKAVIDFCMEKGLIASKYFCPKCASEMKLVEKKDCMDGFRWRCQKSVEGEKHCVTRSVRSGSWFEESKLAIDDVLIVTYCWIERYANKQTARLARVSPNTVTDWMNFCREVCMEVCVDESTSLGGVGKIVEIDESMFGKRKFNRGKPMKQMWVFGGVQRDSNDSFFEVVPDRSADTLLEIIKRRILDGTTIISDCWKSYDCLKNEGYEHIAVNHSLHFKDPETGAHTNKIEGSWSWIKRELRGKRRVDDFDPYLAEFMWRRRHKNDPENLIDSFLRAIIKTYPPKMKDCVEPAAAINVDDGDDNIYSEYSPTKKRKTEH